MDLGEVPQLEVNQACEEREAALDRKLKDWERQLVKAYLTNHKLKELTPEEMLSIPDFDKVISFRLVSLQSLKPIFLLPESLFLFTDVQMMFSIY